MSTGRPNSPPIDGSDDYSRRRSGSFVILSRLSCLARITKLLAPHALIRSTDLTSQFLLECLIYTSRPTIFLIFALTSALGFLKVCGRRLKNLLLLRAKFTKLRSSRRVDIKRISFWRLYGSPSTKGSFFDDKGKPDERNSFINNLVFRHTLFAR